MLIQFASSASRTPMVRTPCGPLGGPSVALQQGWGGWTSLSVLALPLSMRFIRGAVLVWLTELYLCRLQKSSLRGISAVWSGKGLPKSRHFAPEYDSLSVQGKVEHNSTPTGVGGLYRGQPYPERDSSGENPTLRGVGRLSRR